MKYRAALSLLLLAVLGTEATATEVALAGVIGSRAVLVVDGGGPQTVAIGARTREGVTLKSLVGEVAVVEIDGKPERLRLGDRAVHSVGSSAEDLVLQADSRGHFMTRGRVNGVQTPFLVDTGATLVSLGADAARRAGLDYRRGIPGMSNTANGSVRIWRMNIDSLEVGGVRLHNVEAAVHESDLPFGLLGMSFLNRMQWQREGDKLILKKRY
ncbi:MAG: TIGR02281 family clan AA aspartic protease [Thauera sp.]|nr:TIGR02281 family clan AA aspartic protease [Thauera sp.]